MAETGTQFVLLSFAAGCLVLSIRHFQQKGFLWNNAWLFASEQERKHMDKAPHYRQSAIVFALLCLIFSFGCGSPMENQLAPLAGGRHDGCHIGLRRGIFRPQSLTKPGPNTGIRFFDDIRQVQLPALPNAPAPDD